MRYQLIHWYINKTAKYKRSLNDFSGIQMTGRPDCGYLFLLRSYNQKNDSGANSIIPIPTLKYRISARVIVLSLPSGSSGLNVLHINRKSSTRAFDRYTVVNMTNGVIFVRQTDNRQIVVAPFVFSCLIL